MHRDKKNETVIINNKLSKKEWLFLCFLMIFALFFAYFLLKWLKTDNLIISVLAFVSMLPAIYLLEKRNKWNQLLFLINDLFVPVLWFCISIKKDSSMICLVVCFFFQLIYDFYGIFEWIKIEKRQKENNDNIAL